MHIYIIHIPGIVLLIKNIKNCNMMSKKMKRCLVPAEFNPVAKLYRMGHMDAWNNKYLLWYLTIWQMRKKQMLLENK